MITEYVFDAVRFASLGIQRSIFTNHFIDYGMCKLLTHDQYFAKICYDFCNFKDMNWFNSRTDFRNFKYDKPFKKIFNIFKNDEKYNQHKVYVIKRLDILYVEYTQKILNIKTSELNYFYMHDKNVIRDPKLHLSIIKLIKSCDVYFCD
ncbi:hypothetical protein COBT_001729 [Conglomerata obtusa]